jgi:hypothetical protein
VKLEKYLTAEELCRLSGLTLDELKNLSEFRLLVPDTKDGRYRPKLVGWAKKLKEKISWSISYEEIKNWSKIRFG